MMISNIKETVMFLLWARFLQMMVCNQDNQKHIRGLIGLLAVCMILAPLHHNHSYQLKEMIEEEIEQQEKGSDKITSDFWKDCEEMIDEEMNGEEWKTCVEEQIDISESDNTLSDFKVSIPRIKIRCY